MLTLQHAEVSEVSEVSEVQAPIHAGLADAPPNFSEVSGVSGKVSIRSVGLVPGEKDRPKFVVFDDWHEETGAKYRPR